MMQLYFDRNTTSACCVQAKLSALFGISLTCYKASLVYFSFLAGSCICICSCLSKAVCKVKNATLINMVLQLHKVPLCTLM